MLSNQIIGLISLTKNDVMGMNNELVVRNSEDLKLFKKITMGHQVVMGRSTYESIGKPLEGRHNIIVSSTLPYRMNSIVKDSTTISIARSVQDVVHNQQQARDPKKLVVIGGAKLMDEFLPYLDYLLIHRFDVEVEGDTVLNNKYRTMLELDRELPESGFTRELWTPKVHP